MDSLFAFSVTSAVTLTILWATWKLTMSRVNCARFNRLLLIAIYVAALFAQPLSLIGTHYGYDINHEILFGRAELTGILSDYSEHQGIFSLMPIVIKVYAIGLILTAAYMIYGLIIILRLRAKSTVMTLSDGTDVRILTGANCASFSFMGDIYIDAMCLNSPEREMMILHEKMHVRNLHRLDLLIANVMCVIQWYNPAAWRMLADIKAIHEFEVDAEVLNRGTDPALYQTMLLNTILGKHNFTITNHFNQNSLKTRIIMMCRKPASWRLSLRSLALAPAFVMAMAIVSLPSFKSYASEMSAQAATENPSSEVIKSGTVCDNPEVVGSFPGGEMAMMKFLMENVRYPKEAAEAEVQGKVIVSFIVGADGTISDIKVVRGVAPSLDAEAIRVVKLFPRWTPAKVKGQNVASSYVLPVSFKLTPQAKK